MQHLKFETCLKYKIKDIYKASLSSVCVIEEMSEVNKINIFQHIFLSFYFNCYFKFAILFLDVESQKADMKKQIDGRGNI